MTFPNVKHFKKHEIFCRCGCGLGWRNVDPKVIELADEIREIHGGPIKVTSSCRCSKHNSRVGGARHSRHIAVAGKCVSDALDLKPVGKGARKRFEGFKKLCKEANVFGHTIHYDKKGFIHIDMRGTRKYYKGK